MFAGLSQLFSFPVFQSRVPSFLIRCLFVRFEVWWPSKLCHAQSFSRSRLSQTARSRRLSRAMLMCGHILRAWNRRVGCALEIGVRAFLARRRALEIGVRAHLGLKKSRLSAEPHQACWLAIYDYMGRRAISHLWFLELMFQQRRKAILAWQAFSWCQVGRTILEKLSLAKHIGCWCRIVLMRSQHVRWMGYAAVCRRCLRIGFHLWRKRK